MPEFEVDYSYPGQDEVQTATVQDRGRIEQLRGSVDVRNVRELGGGQEEQTGTTSPRREGGRQTDKTQREERFENLYGKYEKGSISETEFYQLQKMTKKELNPGGYLNENLADRAKSLSELKQEYKSGELDYGTKDWRKLESLTQGLPSQREYRARKQAESEGLESLTEHQASMLGVESEWEYATGRKERPEVKDEVPGVKEELGLEKEPEPRPEHKRVEPDLKASLIRASLFEQEEPEPREPRMTLGRAASPERRVAAVRRTREMEDMYSGSVSTWISGTGLPGADVAAGFTTAFGGMAEAGTEAVSLVPGIDVHYKSPDFPEMIVKDMLGRKGAEYEATESWYQRRPGALAGAAVGEAAGLELLGKGIGKVGGRAAWSYRSSVISGLVKRDELYRPVGTTVEEGTEATRYIFSEPLETGLKGPAEDVLKRFVLPEAKQGIKFRKATRFAGAGGVKTLGDVEEVRPLGESVPILPEEAEELRRLGQMEGEETARIGDTRFFSTKSGRGIERLDESGRVVKRSYHGASGKGAFAGGMEETEDLIGPVRYKQKMSVTTGGPELPEEGFELRKTYQGGGVTKTGFETDVSQIAKSQRGEFLGGGAEEIGKAADLPELAPARPFVRDIGIPTGAFDEVGDALLGAGRVAITTPANIAGQISKVEGETTEGLEFETPEMSYMERAEEDQLEAMSPTSISISDVGARPRERLEDVTDFDVVPAQITEVEQAPVQETEQISAPSEFEEAGGGGGFWWPGAPEGKSRRERKEKETGYGVGKKEYWVPNILARLVGGGKEEKKRGEAPEEIVFGAGEEIEELTGFGGEIDWI